MRIVVIDPAADWSTRDVFDGLMAGLTLNGHEAIPCYYGQRIIAMKHALTHAWESRGKKVEDTPGPVEVLRHASDLAITFAMRHRPEWVIVVSGMFFHEDGFKLLRQHGYKVALLLTESPYDFHKESAAVGMVDLAWTNERTAVEPLRHSNPQTYYLRHAFNAQRHTPTPFAGEEDLPAHDVVFCGTAFPERIELLDAIDWTGIDLGLYGMWEALPEDHRLRQYMRGGVTPNELTAALYRRAKIGLNLFRQSVGFGDHGLRVVGGVESLGPRSYELAATGCFHLSEYRAEIPEVFGALVPTFGTPAELNSLLRRWLPDHSGRSAIRAQLPEVVSGHSWVNRAMQIVRDLQGAVRRDVAA